MELIDFEQIVTAILQENSETEKRQLSQKSMKDIHAAMDDFAKKIYGDEYDLKDTRNTEFYFPKGDAEIKKNLDITSGLFSIGNDKLSDDTLIINFTSALGCPSLNDCPITQKACYAVAQENRLKDVRRKNILVQNAVLTSRSKGMLDGFFEIAKMYIQKAKKTKRPIKYIRFNEVGDFVDQKMLEMAARFAYEVLIEYGIKSMAYTAKKTIDPSKSIKIGEKEIPIDEIIAMNRSRNDIKVSDNAVDRNFFGIELPMKQFSDNPNVNLENAYSDVVQVSDDLANKLDVLMPIRDDSGDPCIPTLKYGSWNGGEGWYYVCPCSFWKYNKIKAANKFLEEKGIFKLLNTSAVDIMKNERMAQGKKDITKAIGLLMNIDSYPDTNQGVLALNKGLTVLEENNIIPKSIRSDLKNLLAKIKSPCGIKCSVCHDTQGGVTQDGEKIKKYTILTATHGSTASNYSSSYANAKRKGDDSVKYSDDNPHGHVTKYKDEYNAKKPKSEHTKQDSLDNESDIQKESIIKKNKNLFYEILNNIKKK